MPYNFIADSFHTKKLCSRLSSSEVENVNKIAFRDTTVSTFNGRTSLIIFSCLIHFRNAVYLRYWRCRVYAKICEFALYK